MHHLKLLLWRYLQSATEISKNVALIDGKLLLTGVHRHVQANLARQNLRHENVMLCDDFGLEYLSLI